MKAKSWGFLGLALCITIPIEIVVLKAWIEHENYSQYVNKIRNENWARGTYDQAIAVFEKELANPDNEKEFMGNEILIRSPDGRISLSGFMIKVGDIYMLLNKQDYIKYRKYVIKRSLDFPLGVEVEVNWSEQNIQQEKKQRRIGTGIVEPRTSFLLNM